MKRLLVLSAFLFCLTLSAAPQRPELLRFRGWIEGYRLSDAAFNNEKTYDVLTCFGVGAEYIFTEKIGLKFAAGATLPELKDNINLDEQDTTLVFWQGELLLTYHLDPRSDFDIYAQAGTGVMGGVRAPHEKNTDTEAVVGLFVYTTLGVGANYFIEKNFFIGAEARWITHSQAIRAEGLKTFEAGKSQFSIKLGFAL